MANSMMIWDPFQELDAMQERMDQLFRRSLTGGAQWPSLPATDIYEEKGRLVVETALPNFAEKEVSVQVSGDRLEIKAEHSAEEEQKERSYLRRESSQSSYYRQFVLPKDVDADSAQAKLEDGVLRVAFDRRELPQPKKLSIAAAKKPAAPAKTPAKRAAAKKPAAKK